MPLSREELATAKRAMKENREYDYNREPFPRLLSLFCFLPLTNTAFYQWHKGDVSALYLLGVFACVLLPLSLFYRARRMRYLKSRYAANSALLEKLKAAGCPGIFPEQRPQRALLWRLDAFLRRKRTA